MNTDHSSARPVHEYQPTIIETRFLISSLAIQIAFLKNELKRDWVDFKTDPAVFTARATQNLYATLKNFVSTPNAMYACATALMAITCVVIIAFVVQSTSFPVAEEAENLNEPPLELVLLDVAPPPDPQVGKPGGTGLSVSDKPFQGISGGGNRNPLPPQFGKMPQPSIIPAAIPITPPINPQTLPVAGIDIDPSLWKDVDARVYGDPNSKSEIPSSGPGEGGGIGTGKGPRIGSGGDVGSGCGTMLPGEGGGWGPGSGCRAGSDKSSALMVSQVDQRARLLFKPEPQYTEEARQNQITGTVMLRVVFSSAGEVDQIRAVRTLPFGLTERAIAAARQIKFVPATKDGRPVSVQMQLEYNFNLY
jgi:TonB family protein